MTWPPGCRTVWCLVIWTSAAVPTDVVAGYCLITAAVAFALHFTLETTVMPQGATPWTAIVVLGVIPLGAAFYAWDWGCFVLERKV